ncbi:GGDEF domain-containing protein [Nitratidesulfovibrio liaohensis]|uniref:diguanylate cyclase n=1 Tax=Nitratidesulfovibrio liaohensis TaxID=2604158 RepID=A0ABY9QYA9_9BACT|nr:GGDEF domain-containing protein [Nitratidesulfovibrio liaohensis]EGY23908.1 diguanylate cyclase domain protein [Desulfovibrio sp. A2]WMW64520.1 GGDEF domain-containing protein [Nitratidesulfovibrio liaohensis]
MKTLKIKAAVFLVVAVSTFILTQGFYRKNIGMLHDSLNMSLGIVEEMHVAESFHSSMHSMVIYASAYLSSHDDEYKKEYEKKLQEGEKAVAKLVGLRFSKEYNEHLAHTGLAVGDEIATNLGAYFLELKNTLAPIMSGDDENGKASLAKANKIFDEVFHRYYVKIHTSHYSSLEDLQNEAHRIFETSNYIYISQLVLAVSAGIFLILFADRVFLKIYKLTEQHSLTDSLTAVHNRRYLDTVVAGEISNLNGSPCSVVILDIDDFKKYNDSYGHVAGDKLLKELAGVLRKVLRETDRLIRYGGEEFLVVLPGTAKAQAIVVAEKLCHAVREEAFSLPDGEPARPVTASLGVATMPEDGKEFAAALKAADSLLYRAKRKGKNRVAAFEEDERKQG